jgi:hypothetical protein
MDWLRFLIPILALMIPIVAIVMPQWRRVQEKKLALMAQGYEQAATEADARLERLEERVKVLERIATDRRISLSDEIARLEDRP